MTLRNFALGWLALLLSLQGAAAQAPFPQDPLLQLQADGPTASVQALAFGPRGETLYSAGYDKVVHSWRRTGDGTFAYYQSYRIPVGPGEGLLNALAVSPDGRWLAVAGLGLFRDAAGFRQSGFLMPRETLKPDALRDQGTIYLFDTAGKVPVRPLVGHQGPVLSMIFAPAQGDKSALLISACQERDAFPYRGRLRLWDAVSGKELRHSDPFDTSPDGRPDGRRPAQAVWRTGPGERDVAVAVGVREQPVRVWDGSGASLRSLEESAQGRYNRPVAFLPDQTGGLLVSGFVSGGGKVNRWRVRGKGFPSPEAKPDAVPVGGGASALTALPGKPGTAPALAAAVRVPKENAFRLFVFTRQGNNLEPVRPDGLLLWKGDDVTPAIAASPDGRFVAVASTPANEVLVYRAADLLAGGAPRPITLRSDGILVKKAEFARAGKERALLLRTAAPEKTLVLEFGRGLSEGKGGAVPEAPPGASDWTIESTRERLTLQGPGFATDIPLPTDVAPADVTASAVLPRGGRRLPLLALAYVQGNVHYLGLFDADRGFRQVRQYSGHADRITSLAFAREGRLLVSSSDDKTVSLWSLTDLNQHLGRHGMIHGLTVGDGLRIVRLDKQQLSPANQAALGKLAVGDQITSIVGKDGKPTRPKGPVAFYEALFHLPADSKVTLQIAGKRDVMVTLDHGIDDQKPLVSFFFRRDERGRPQWLGWSPHGPYDASDPAALERRIAWHVNPPNARRPVEIFDAAKYRREYHRKGIVPKLVRHANREDALRELLREPAPPPDMSLQLEGFDAGAPGEERNNAVLQQAPRALRAQVENIEPWRVEKVRWRVNRGPPQPFDNAGDDTYTADLGKRAWRRGTYTFELVVTTTDLAEHVSRPPLVLQIVPPKPKVRVLGKLPKETKEQEQTIRAEAEATRQDHLATPRVRLVLRHNGQVVARTEYGKEGEKVAGEWKVKLKEDANEVIVSAENEGAPPGSALEDASERVILDYRPAPPPAPTIVLETVRPEKGDDVSLLPKAPEVVVVASPRVRVLGRIVSEAPLAEATLDGRPLRGFDAKAKLRRFTIGEVVDLQPGQRRLSFRAAAERGKLGPASLLTLAFHPELPRLDPSQPRRLDLRATDKPNQPRDYRLRVQLAPPSYPAPYTAQVRVNEEAELVPATVNPDDHTVTARVTLRPGRNTIRLVLKNQYRGPSPIDEALTVVSPRPPAILSLKATAPKEAEATLEADVESALDVSDFRVVVNGEPQRAVKKERRRDPNGPARWKSVLRDIRLEEGKNTIKVVAVNAEGESRSAEIEVERKRPAVVPPRIVRLYPVQVSPVEEPAFRLEFRVESRRGMEPVVLLNDDKVTLPAPEAVGGADVYRLQLTGLRVGPNDVEIHCGDAARHRLNVSYTPRWTARLHFERLERPDARGTFLPLKGGAPVGHVWLHGHIEYRNERALREHQGGVLECLVNDFQQLAPEVGEANLKELRRPFRLNLRLNRENNQVVVKLPEALKLVGNKTEETIALACAKPEKDQRLHLMVLGPGQREPALLAQRVLEAFQATGVRGNRFRTKVFQEGVLYGPYPAFVTPEMVIAGLTAIQAKLRHADAALNDVTIVFFSGEERFANGRHYLMTTKARATGDLGDAIDVDKVRGALQKTRGAKLLLLDTQSSSQGARSLATLPTVGTPRVGVYRYVWLSEGAAPEKDRLVEALRITLPKAPLVRDQREQLSRWAEGRADRAAFSLQVPPGLESLKLSEREAK